MNEPLEKVVLKSITDATDTNLDEMKRSECNQIVYSYDQDRIYNYLSNGGYIGYKNDCNQFSMNDIMPELLKEQFDNCITTNNIPMSDKNFEITFDYNNFVPPPLKDYDPEKMINEKFENEMFSIENLSKTKHHKHLLQHPLIASYLTLKWQYYSFMFYINFGLNVIFSLLILTYAMLSHFIESTNFLLKILWIILCIFLTIIFIRETFQICNLPRIYYKNVGNYFLIAIFVLSILIMNKISENISKTCIAIIILLTFGNIILLTGSLSFMSFAIHLEMLQIVTINFMKSLLLYANILIAFALCFYILLHEKMDAEKNDKNDNDENEINKFSNVFLTMGKIVIMMTGEFDASNIKFSANSLLYLVFFMFLFLVSIILMNLLNGLAVNDIQVRAFS